MTLSFKAGAGMAVANGEIDTLMVISDLKTPGEVLR